MAHVINHSCMLRSRLRENIKSPGRGSTVRTNMVEYLQNPETSEVFLHILCLGDEATNSQTFVIVSGHAIETDSLLETVDLCFKSFFVLDANYNALSFGLAVTMLIYSPLCDCCSVHFWELDGGLAHHLSIGEDALSDVLSSGSADEGRPPLAARSGGSGKRKRTVRPPSKPRWNGDLCCRAPGSRWGGYRPSGSRGVAAVRQRPEPASVPLGGVRCDGVRVSRFTMVAPAYKHIRECILTNAKVMSETTLQLPEVNAATVTQCFRTAGAGAKGAEKRLTLIACGAGTSKGPCEATDISFTS
ncbi:hypothetical protein E1301_Tti021593 [Triplophysa tibetana]|uniref:Uncharacterized protein n=1 Tax=Triplophysa tibetana TaxID=1572043 RepID=A0A5A9PHA4_9TELE|nr:hypothetical protein E1301_Tti021593 [Triplophysa tibetana]